MLPALSQAKAHGKAKDCMNNQRQIYLAFAIHADDYDDHFPWTSIWWRILGEAGPLALAISTAAS